MKLGPVTKLDRRNTATLKTGDDVMSKNCDVIVFFPIHDPIVAIQKPDCGRMIYYIYINKSLLFYKN